MMMGGEDEVQQETGSMRGRKSALQTREVNFGYAPTKVLAMFFFFYSICNHYVPTVIHKLRCHGC